MRSISSDLYEETLKPNKSHTSRITQIVTCKTTFKNIWFFLHGYLILITSVPIMPHNINKKKSF